MKRRNFLAGAAATAAASVAAPAIGQSRIEWDMVTSWPTGAPGLHDSATRIAKRITELSGGRLTVNVHGAGEIVPAFGVFDAVSQGTAELYHSVPSYWISKTKGIGLFGSFPFGLTPQEIMAWMHHGGAQELYDRAYDGYGLKGFIAGDSGPQWFGWFPSEIKTVDDLNGLRFRTSGFNGDVLRRTGVAVVSMSLGEIFQALQAGTIDAAEFLGPWTDMAFGFHQVAKNLYYPGIGEPASSTEVGINKSKYEALPKDLQRIVKAAIRADWTEAVTTYDINHTAALKTLQEEHDVKVRKVPDEIMTALGESTNELVAELLDDSDPLTREIMASYAKFRNQSAEYAKYSYAGVMNARDFSFKTG